MDRRLPRPFTDALIGYGVWRSVAFAQVPLERSVAPQIVPLQ
jgi:hypothetical protein